MTDISNDLDAAWYAQRYPDVALSGLSPQDHYRRFGRYFGRSANGKGETRSIAERRPPEAAPSQPTRPAVEDADVRPAALTAEPIIDRPANFDPYEGRVVPFERAVDPGTPLQVTALIAESADPALLAYSRLARLDVPGPLKDAPVSCAALPFRSGPTRIENAWFASRSLLRIMLAGEAPDRQDVGRVVLRAYQAKASNPDELLPLQSAVQLPPVGPVFHDFQLLQSFMPVLLELSRADGSLARSLMPFPSLLPGGLHNAELKALQTEANPMDDFWSSSDGLLREAVGGPDAAPRSIASVRQDSVLDHPLAGEVNEWLAAVFVLKSGEEIEGDDKSDGLALFLPANSVPTISAIVSRQIDLGGSAFLAGPYLLADAESFKPRWSVVPPVGGEPWKNVAVIRSRSATAAFAREGRPAPIHLAISLRSSVPSDPVAPDVTSEGRLDRPISAVIEIADFSRARTTIQALRDAAGNGGLEFLIRLRDDSAEMKVELDRLCGVAAWSSVPWDADLPDLARGARHEYLLSIGDCIRLDDSKIVTTLMAMLDEHPDAGSASCALLGETVVKRQTVVTPASGGLFPAGISFATSPRLSFWEPDVLEALPHQTYPVVANTVHLTLFRKEALAKLRASGRADDIRLGLDLIEAGYRNWCTTEATATLTGGYVRRDSIDPVGGAYAELGRWQDLLPRVALVRQLY